MNYQYTNANQGTSPIPSSTGNVTITPGSNSNSLYYAPITGNNTVSFTGVIQPAPKNNIKYAVLTQGGIYKVLNEKSPIAPRNLIGILKFITCAQQSSLHGVKFNWVQLIDNLDISVHFDEVSLLKNEPDTLIIELS